MPNLALEQSTRLTPHGLHHSRCKALRFDVSHGPLLLSACFGVGAIEAHAVGLREVGAKLGAPILARTR